VLEKKAHLAEYFSDPPEEERETLGEALTEKRP